MLWGRGAVDMLDMDAMTLAVVATGSTGRKPARDVVLAFVARRGGRRRLRRPVAGAAPPGAVRGLHEAISEVGGFSLSVNDDLRLYMIETAQKGMAGCA
jgi:acetylornithine deacetylase/succinyl-diaminopimelate desuccinylase-like protein